MIPLEKLLSEFPIFSSLTPAVLHEFARIAATKEFRKGEIIYEEAKPADYFYLVLSGRVKVYTEASLREGRVLDYLYRGTCFGLISLLTGDTHTVTAEAANDSVIATVPKDAFLDFLKKYPPLALEFSNVLSRRVKKRAGKSKDIFESLVLSAYGSEERIGVTLYSIMLGKALSEESAKKVVVVEIRKDNNFFIPSREGIVSLPQVTEPALQQYIDRRWGFDYLRIRYDKGASLDYEKEVPFLLGVLTQRYNFIILDLPPELTSLTTVCLVQSDSIHCVCRKGWPDLAMFPRHLRAAHHPHSLPEGKIKVVLQEPPPPQRIPRALEEGSAAVFATVPFIPHDAAGVLKQYPDSLYARSVRRIARETSGVRLGLALGSGGAFGLAHIGVLKVLERHKIPIDIIAGSSIGAIVGALWALGKSADEVHTVMRAFQRTSIFSFWDIGYLRKSVLKGARFRRIINGLFKETSFYDLKIPVLITAFDFKQRSAYVISRNNFLREAILASCAMPGTFKPVTVDQRMLLDGGVLTPVPVGPLIRENVKKIITVCATPTKEEAKKTYERMPRALNIFDFIFGSIDAIQDRFIREDLSLADVVIHPRLEGMVWTDFTRLDEFVKKGEEEAEKQIEKIKALQKS